MSSASDKFDIVYLGLARFDEVIPSRGVPRVAPGSAVRIIRLAAWTTKPPKG